MCVCVCFLGAVRVLSFLYYREFLRLPDAIPVTENVTDGVMAHCSQPHGVCIGANHTFGALVGKNVSLAIEFSAAILYTISFTAE